MRLLLAWSFFLLLAEGGLSFSGLCSACVKKVPVRTGWRGLAQGPTCNQPFRTGNLLAERPFSVVPTPCSSSRRSALLRLLSSGPVSDGGAEERDQASGQLEAADGTTNAGKKELKSAEGKLKTAEGKLEAAKEDLKTAEGKLEAAEGKLEAAEGKLEAAEGKLEAAEGKLEAAEGKLEAATDSEQKALAQKACDRAEKAYELAVKNVNTARENVNTARENVNTARENVDTGRENVNRAGRAVDIALDALQRAGAEPTGAADLRNNRKRRYAIKQTAVLSKFIARAPDAENIANVESAIAAIEQAAARSQRRPFAFVLGSSGIGKTQLGITMCFGREGNKDGRCYYSTASDLGVAQEIYEPFSAISICLNQCATMDMEAQFEAKKQGKRLTESEKKNALSVAELQARDLYLFGWIRQVVEHDPWINVDQEFDFEFKRESAASLQDVRDARPSFFIDEISGVDRFTAQAIRNAFRAGGFTVILAGTSSSAANVIEAAAATGYQYQKWCYLLTPSWAVSAARQQQASLRYPLVRRCLEYSRPLFSLAAEEALDKEQPQQSLEDTMEAMCSNVFDAAVERKDLFGAAGGRHGQLCMLLAAYHKFSDAAERDSGTMEKQGTNLVNAHFAVPAAGGLMGQWLSTQGRKLLRQDGKQFTEDCYFPSAEDDLLLHLSLAGTRTRAALQSREGVRQPLARFLRDERKGGTAMTNPSTTFTSGLAMESLLSGGFCLASRNNGFSGVSMENFLTGFASEVVPTYERVGFTLDTPPELREWLQTKSVPFLSPPNQPWPQAVMECPEIDFGNLARGPNMWRVDCRVQDAGLSGESKDREQLTGAEMVKVCNRIPEQSNLHVVLVRRMQMAYFKEEGKSLEQNVTAQCVNVTECAFLKAIPSNDGRMVLDHIPGMPAIPAHPARCVVFFELDKMCDVSENIQHREEQPTP